MRQEELEDEYAHGIRERDVVVRDAFDGSLLADFGLLDAYLPSAEPPSEPLGQSSAQSQRRPKPTLRQHLVREQPSALVLRTNAQGIARVRVDRTRETDRVLIPLDAAWYAVNPNRIFRARTLWVFRLLQVHVTVIGDGAVLDPQRASRTYRLVYPREPKHYAPTGIDSAERQRIYRIARAASKRRRAHAEETSPLLVPRCRGFVLRAQAPGFRSAAVAFDPPVSGERASVVLTLTRAMIISGTVRDEDGQVLDYAHILVRVRLPAPQDPVEADMLRAGSGWHVLGAGREHDTHLLFYRSLESDFETGAFRAELPLEGHVTLRVWRKGYKPEEIDLGALAEDRNDIAVRLVARRGRLPPRVPVSRGDDQPLGYSGELIVWELEGAAVLRAIPVRVTRDGLMTTEDLRLGMRYMLLAGGNRLGAFAWEEQREIILKR